MSSELHQHLVEAERIVADYEQRVAEQQVLIGELLRVGMSPDNAHGMLLALEDARRLAGEHRDLILQEMREG